MENNNDKMKNNNDETEKNNDEMKNNNDEMKNNNDEMKNNNDEMKNNNDETEKNNDELNEDNMDKGVENNKDSYFNDQNKEYINNELTSNINFRKNTKKIKTKKFLNVVAIILIGTISGILGATYVQYKNNGGTYDYSKNNISLFKDNRESGKTAIPYNAINKVAEIVGPTVVGIRNNVEDIFYDKQKVQGTGSGIIFRSDGYIVTNYHVIKDAQKLQVLLSGETNPLEAKIVGYDEISDLAVIKVEAKNLPTATLGDSSKVRVGDLAVAIGNPLGEEFKGSVTAGIISALNRKIEIPNEKTNQSTVYKVLQTDAAINPGNSGGALSNEKGEVIGINSLKASTSIGEKNNVEGMGFAIPSNQAKNIIESLIKYGKVRRPYLGILGMDATKEVTGSDDVKGVYIKSVMPNTGMAQAGINPGDVIVELDGKKITNFDDLRNVIENHKIGDKVSCKVWRFGKDVIKEVTLTEMPGQSSK